MRITGFPFIKINRDLKNETLTMHKLWEKKIQDKKHWNWNYCCGFCRVLIISTRTFAYQFVWFYWCLNWFEKQRNPLIKVVWAVFVTGQWNFEHFFGVCSHEGFFVAAKIWNYVINSWLQSEKKTNRQQWNSQRWQNV